MATVSFGSVAQVSSSTTARLAKNLHSLVSTAQAVSATDLGLLYKISQPVPPVLVQGVVR